MGSSRRYRESRSKKRKFKGNQHTDNPKRSRCDNVAPGEAPKGRPRPSSTASKDLEKACTSAKKLETSGPEVQRTDFGASDMFILIGMMCLKAMIAEVGQCKECYKKKLNVENVANKRMGYCYSIQIYCMECGWSTIWQTSSTINKSNSPGQKPYEINLRMIAGFREFGQGLRSMETFSRCR